MFIPEALAQASNRASNTVSAITKTAENAGFLDTFIDMLLFGKNLIIAGIITFVFFLLGKVIKSRIVNSIRKAKGDLYPDMESLIGRMTNYTSLFVGAAVSAQFVFGVDFLQVLGFFSLGLGFAFKDLLMNLMSGIIIVLQDRYHIGDFIQVGQEGIKGTVMEIQTRATILKAIDGTEIIVPNSELLNKAVTVYTAHHTRRIDVIVGVHYSTDLSLAKRLVEQTMAHHKYVLKTPPPEVLMDEFANSSINLSCRFWVDPKDPDSPSWFNIKSEVIHAIKSTFEAHGITIPFPQRTVYQAASEEGQNWKNHPANSQLLADQSDEKMESQNEKQPITQLNNLDQPNNNGQTQAASTVVAPGTSHGAEEPSSGVVVEHQDGKTVKVQANAAPQTNAKETTKQVPQ
jgi:small conductance mechanosensitive channel